MMRTEAELRQIALDLSSRALYVKAEPVFENTLKLSFSGTLSLNTVNPLSERLEDLLQGSYTNLLVDMTHVEYVSSTGIGLLMNLRRHQKAKGGKMVMLNASQTTKDIIKLLGFSTVLSAHEPRTN
jgi:anti-sigma B factor antagonist